MVHVPTSFDGVIEDIALAGEQLTAMSACEGAAGNISVFTRSLACPLDTGGRSTCPRPRRRWPAGGW